MHIKTDWKQLQKNDKISENTQSAESKLRDLDMVSEMVRISVNSVITQAAQTMLAQANSSANAILQLIQ